MKNDALKHMKNSYIANAYQKLKDKALQAEVIGRFDQLLSENDLGNKMIAYHLVKAILPAIAFHDVLTSHGADNGDSKEQIRESVLNAAKSAASLFQVIGKIPFFFPLMRRMVKIGLRTKYGETGWDFVWTRDDPAALVWDCRRCLYADVFQKYGMPELTEIFCESDDVAYGNIPGVRWGRTQTIGRGDPICDFKLYNEKMKGI